MSENKEKWQKIKGEDLSFFDWQKIKGPPSNKYSKNQTSVFREKYQKIKVPLSKKNGKKIKGLQSKNNGKKSMVRG